MPDSPHFGLLTGGGDCPGLNAVIRSVTKTLMLRHGARVTGFDDGFQGLIEQRCRELNYRDVSGILTRGGTILGSSNKANPTDHNGRDVSAEVVAYAKSLGIQGLIAIGGDGTMSIAHELEQHGLPVVGVPKTIDNDIVGTDRTFGFDTAVMIASEAIDRLHSTAQSHQRVMIIETMGRYTGWIALHAGVASGADIILIPEVEYNLSEVAHVCEARAKGGQRFTIIAIAEGARPEGGSLSVQRVVADSPDPIRLGGAGQLLASSLESMLDSEVRATILGHVQRGGTPTAFDRVLSTEYGVRAADLAAAGTFGVMVALQKGSITTVPLAEVAQKTRTVPPDELLVHAALSVGTSFGATQEPWNQVVV
ncbi:ATP-dependent 6-phosphofructokinase [soil metagenome]